MSDGLGAALPGGVPLGGADALAVLAAAATAGAEPCLVTEVAASDAVALLAGFAARRPGHTVGTGIVPLGTRTNATLAMGATTIADIAGADVLLGVGVSTPPIVEGWHDAVYDASIATVTAHVTQLRGLLDRERRGSFRLPETRGRVKVLLAALGPRMTDVALRVADGVIFNLTPASALPAVPSDKDVLAYVWTRIGEGADEAMRRDLVAYATTAAYGRHFTRLGFGSVVDEVRALHAEGRLREAPSRIPEEFLDAVTVDAAHLATRVAEVRAQGAQPIVLPCVSEREVDEGRLGDHLVEAIHRATARERTG